MSADEIIIFLEGSGFVCSRRSCCGHEVICVEMPEGKDRRMILPLEIKASGLEEAGKFSDAAYEAVKSFDIYPLIITEDRWKSRRPMMEARLLAHLEVFEPVFARNCVARRIGKDEAEAFLSDCHSYGYAACKYRYGLFTKKEGRLVAVATFSNARKWNKDGKEIRSYEWTRYASLPGVRISGGMGKLLKTFINEVHPDDIMSYADLEWSEGEVYKRLGFIREEGKEPVSFMVNPQTWERKAIRNGEMIPGHTDGGMLFFRNFGSAKYRLKLTDYA